jgi:NifU-like protein involved in Fe-S cluster formation
MSEHDQNSDNPSSSLDAFLEGLQAKVDAQAMELYGEHGFQRWLAAERFQRLPDADARGCVKGNCGDTIEIFLKIQDERVTDASYFTDGCGASKICASWAVELALGKSLDQAVAVEPEDILARLDVFPEEERHCATLAAAALKQAVHEWMTRENKA